MRKVSRTEASRGTIEKDAWDRPEGVVQLTGSVGTQMGAVQSFLTISDLIARKGDPCATGRSVLWVGELV